MNRLVLALGVAVVVAAAVLGYLLIGGEGESPGVAEQRPAGDKTAVSPPSVPATTETPATTAQTSESGSSEPPVAAPSAAEPEQPARPQVVARDGATGPASEEGEKAGNGPTFDVVRVEPSGETVIAGRAAPNSQVTVTLDEDGTVGTAQADRSGAWAIVAEEPLAPGSHEIGIEAKTPEGEKQLSENLVVVMVPEPKAEAKTEPEANETDTPAEREAPAVLAVLTPRVGSGASRVLPQGEEEGIAAGSLVLDSVDYDESGRAILGGRATPGASMLVYLDNRPIGEAVAGPDGRWVLKPASPILEGLHQLRVDEVNADGTVVARVETPFSRERAQPIEAGEAYVIVQPGNSLWRIARRTYGEGLRYTVIYQANAEQIRDPDLIYPGQVFALPKRN